MGYVCSEPGCWITLGRSGKCDTHKRPAFVGAGRGSTRAWRRLRRIVFVRDRGVCQSCGKHTRGRFVCDHVIEVADGGTDAITNLQTLCQDCSNSKTRRSQQARKARRDTVQR